MKPTIQIFDTINRVLENAKVDRSNNPAQLAHPVNSWSYFDGTGCGEGLDLQCNIDQQAQDASGAVLRDTTNASNLRDAGNLLALPRNADPPLAAVVGNINNAFRQALAAQGLSAATVTVAFGPEGLVLKRYQRPGGLVPSYPPADVGRY